MKKVPNFKTDQEAEDFLDQDLTDYLNLKHFEQASFEFLPKSERVNLRVSKSLLEAVRKNAEQRGVSYQKYIRLAIEQSLVRDQKQHHPDP